MRFFKLALFLSAVYSALLLSKVSFAEAPQAGDAFITSLGADPVNLIPFLASDSASSAISGLIFNGLVKYDKDLKLVGDLAESWEVLDGGLRIIFRLRKNVLWHDGASFSAKDVEFTFKKVTDPGVPTPYASAFDKVASVGVLDNFTFEVVYKEPFAPGLASWGMGIIPAHLLEGHDLMRSVFSRQPVGTGPYILKKWKTNQQIELVANPRYFEGKPFISRYICRIIPESSAQLLELQTENLDMASLTPLQFEKQTDTAFFRKTYQKFRYPSFGYTYLGYNLKDPLFSDQSVRKAIGMAIHKREIIQVAFKGLGQVATGPFLPGSWASNSLVKESDFNPSQARKLLESAGWVDSNADGILDRGGKNFSFTLLTHQGGEERKMAAEIIQKRLKDVGIDMKIQTVEWSVFLKEFIDKRRFQAVILGWNLSKDPDIFDIFHSSKMSLGQFNFVSYQNAEVDRLLEEGRRIYDEAARATVYRRVHEILAHEEPYTFLAVPDSLVAVHRRFEGVELAPAGIGTNFIKWFVPRDKQKYKIK